MDILIHIPNENIPTKQDMIDISLHFISGHVSSCTYPFTELKKGHGRLIDANSIYQIVRPIEPSDAEWGMTAETAKQIVLDVFDRAPTIIEADIAESEIGD